MDLKKLYENVEEYIDKEVILEGGIRNHRKQKEFGFIDFYDGTCFKHIQVVYTNKLKEFDEISKIKIGSSIEVLGEVIKSEGKGQDYEINAKTIKVEFGDKCIPIIKEQTVGQNDKTYKINESDFPSGSNNTPKFVYAPVTHSYVNMIKTRNQTITFNTSECEENSGRRLNSIVVLSCNNDVVKNYVFSYGKFGCSGIGGNEGISDKTKPDFRLKLDNVKEIASGETHTTSFSYYSTDLPSQMSCARDYWGYYNGQQNKRDNSGRYTLIPAPQEFMSRNYKPELSKRFVGVKYADRFSRDDYMQVGILNRIDYPTGGYTTYEYEANRIPVKKLEELFASCGSAAGKKGCALVLKFGLSSNKMCNVLMDQLERQGMKLDYFEVIENAEHSVAVGKKIG